MTTKLQTALALSLGLREGSRTGTRLPPAISSTLQRHRNVVGNWRRRIGRRRERSWNQDWGNWEVALSGRVADLVVPKIFVHLY